MALFATRLFYIDFEAPTHHDPIISKIFFEIITVICNIQAKQILKIS